MPWRASTGRLPVLFVIPLCAMALAGCPATQSYVVTLYDGSVYRSAHAPVLNSKTGYYKFRDRFGQDVLLRDREVASIVQDEGN